MQAPITVNYVPDGEDWTITVTRDEETRQATAPGLIAARDRADQLVEQIAPNPAGHRTVVHLLEGDAFAFTTSYLHARLGLPELPPAPVIVADEVPVTEVPAQASAEPEVTTGTLPIQPTPARPEQPASVVVPVAAPIPVAVPAAVPIPVPVPVPVTVPVPVPVSEAEQTQVTPSIAAAAAAPIVTTAPTQTDPVP